MTAPTEDQGERRDSYRSIFRASAIVGGAEGMTILVGVVRAKCVAVFLGPTGVGLHSNYQSILLLAYRIGSLGAAGSAVRSIAAATKPDGDSQVGVVVGALRVINVITGLLSALALAAFAYPISRAVFGDNSYGAALMVLGVVNLLRNLLDIHTASIQGHRRVGDLARVKVYSAIGTAVISITIYATRGIEGIVPALLVNATFNLLVAWFYGSRIKIPRANAALRDYVRAGREIVTIGVTLMWSALLAAVVAMATRTLITHEFGLASVGIFQSSFRLSGMFIGFVLIAMASDFYPRLSEAKGDHAEMNRLINEQTEIGVLLSAPGMIAMVALAPWLIYAFYTPEFLPATALLKWFVIGCCCRVVSWPLSYILLVNGQKRLMFLTDSLFHALHLALVWLGMKYIGLVGVAIAFFVLYVFHAAGMLLLAKHLTGFRWTPGLQRLLWSLGSIATLVFAASQVLGDVWSALFGGVATLIASLYSLRQVALRLGPGHRVIKTLERLPIVGNTVTSALRSGKDGEQ